jgi:pimeloyl-ACP methyl ester carboxylesterase
MDAVSLPESLPAAPPVVRRDLDTPSGPIALLDSAPAASTGRQPALLVPGYTGSKEDFVGILGTIAAAGHRVVAMDQRGQFESPGPDDPAAYTVEALAADLRAVLADLAGPDRQRVHLLGHSFGGLVARAAAVAEPAAVASVVLLCSGPAGIGGGRKARMEALAPLLAAGGMPAVYEHMERLAAGDARAAAAPPELKAFLRRRFLASAPAGLAGMGQALLGEPDRVAPLRATGLPVLVAHGVDDDAWPPAVQEEMAGRLGARYAVVPGAAHSPAAERPATTAGLLLGFWAETEGRPAGAPATEPPAR